MTTTLKIENEILERIRSKDRATLSTIYKEGYPMVEKYVLNNSGSQTDAQDVFQDAMYLLIKKAALNEFRLSSKPSTFIFGIAKNLWLKQLSKGKVDALALQIENDLNTDEDVVDLNQLTRVKQMKTCLINLGQPCQTILEQFYFIGTSMKEIAKMLHYTNANNAKNQKYKCFMRLKKMMTEVVD